MLEIFHEMFELYKVDERIKAFGGKLEYHEFYSALDAFHDIECGFCDIQRNQTKLSILTCIGFMQGLVTQQNALISLNKIFSLSKDLHSSKTFKYQRELRDRISGHPIDTPAKGMKRTSVRSTFFPSYERGVDWFTVAFYGGGMNAQ